MEKQRVCATDISRHVISHMESMQVKALQLECLLSALSAFQPDGYGFERARLTDMAMDIAIELNNGLDGVSFPEVAA